jgi:hypothetical protein
LWLFCSDLKIFFSDYQSLGGNMWRFVLEYLRKKKEAGGGELEGEVGEEEIGSRCQSAAGSNIEVSSAVELIIIVAIVRFRGGEYRGALLLGGV